MKRFVPFFAVAIVALLIGFAVGWIRASSISATKLERVVAFSWGDGKYGWAFYGAHVYLQPIPGGYSVRARVYMGRGNDRFHDCGELGTARTDLEAMARWGAIAWREDGLHIGTGTNEYFLPGTKMERDR